jgi:hypothetical protein
MRVPSSCTPKQSPARHHVGSRGRRRLAINDSRTALGSVQQTSTGFVAADTAGRIIGVFHGTNWRGVIKLHFQICDRLRATSSWAVSS